mmetsp:Transcript_44941/g.119146  ORF Transcript_44941/g.119146 Transcript_44941/m.119146 type:complete len:149 (-) Transcript_44941:1293-1739(-)
MRSVLGEGRGARSKAARRHGRPHQVLACTKVAGWGWDNPILGRASSKTGGDEAEKTPTSSTKVERTLSSLTIGHTHTYSGAIQSGTIHVDVLSPEVQVPSTVTRFMEKGSYLKKGVQSNIGRFMVTGSNLRRSKSHQIMNDAWRRAPT